LWIAYEWFRLATAHQAKLIVVQVTHSHTPVVGLINRSSMSGHPKPSRKMTNFHFFPGDVRPDIQHELVLDNAAYRAQTLLPRW
jgi:hypothetical protein